MEIAMDDDFTSFAAFPASEGEDFSIAEEEENNELSQSTFKGDWKKVVDLYKTQPWLQRSVITSSKDTTLHVAISADREDVVEMLVGSIVDNHNKKALKMKNNRGETPLHCAATRKSVKMCQCILEDIEDLRKKKQKHVWCRQILDEIWVYKDVAYVRGQSAFRGYSLLRPVENFPKPGE
ncbi:hypothetical protein K1719_009618 [Acacia pycnantha]|nr:hypothetical protein K1719_009618 [Acacia pycnantha]